MAKKWGIVHIMSLSLATNPTPVVPHTVNDIVETLCNEGCKAVRGYIRQLELNEPITLLDGLDDLEKTQVLEELRSIMAVYDNCF